MKRILGCLLLGAGQIAAAELSGLWTGPMPVESGTIQVFLTLSHRGNAITGTIAYGDEIKNEPIEKAEVNDGELNFEARDYMSRAVKFRLRLTAAQNALKGEAVVGNRTVPLRLEREGVPGVYRVGNGVSAPVIIYKTNPEYTEEMRQAKLNGTVVLSVQITPEGRAVNARVLRGLGGGPNERALECGALGPGQRRTGRW